MVDVTQLQNIFERLALAAIQILIEYFLYRRYKLSVSKEEHSYKKYLESCFIESVFNENFVNYQSKLNSQVELSPFYSSLSQNQFLHLQDININSRKYKNNQQIDEVFESQLESSQQLMTNQKNKSDSINDGNILNQINVSNSKGKKYFYIFNFIIFLCLPLSIAEQLLSLNLLNCSGQDACYYAQLYICKLVGDLENALDYFCYFFVALMIQNQGIFIKLMQDSYQQQKSQVSQLLRCQLQRSTALVLVIFGLQQIGNISFIIQNRLEIVDQISLFLYTIVFYSFYFQSYFTYSNTKIQKDQVLAGYYKNFYKRYFNFDLFQEFQKTHEPNKLYEMNNENFQLFLNSKMKICLKELDIKQKSLEQNEQFKDLVYNQGIFFQFLIKSLYFFFVFILPTFMASIFIVQVYYFVKNNEKNEDYKYNQLIQDLIEYFVKNQNTSSNNSLKNSFYFQIIAKTYNFLCYLLLFGLKYFIKQQVFFNATAFKVK